MKNVVLLTMARSRSSMTAEIFRRHGWFFGEARKLEDRGVGYNENMAFKQWVKEWRPHLYLDILNNRGRKSEPNVPENFQQKWERQLKKEGWDGSSPWANKVDAFCDKVFDDCVLIGIWRNPTSICESALRAIGHSIPHGTPELWDDVIQAHHDRMSSLRIPMINTDAVVLGVYTSLHEAFEAAGGKLDEEIVKGFVKRG